MCSGRSSHASGEWKNCWRERQYRRVENALGLTYRLDESGSDTRVSMSADGQVGIFRLDSVKMDAECGSISVNL